MKTFISVHIRAIDWNKIKREREKVAKNRKFVFFLHRRKDENVYTKEQIGNR